MPRDGLVQARISNFVRQFPSVDLARGVANRGNQISSIVGDNCLAGKRKEDNEVDLTSDRKKSSKSNPLITS